MFEEKFNKLTNSVKKQFTTYMNELMFTTFIVRKKFDRATGISKTTPAYLFIETYFDIFEDYLSYAGLNLNKDDDYGVIYINAPDGENRLRVDGVTTLVIYALRYHYEDMLKVSSSQTDILMSSTDLRSLIHELGLNKVNKKMSTISMASALRFLASHNIVARATKTFSDPYYTFYILPSIRYIIDSQQMNSLLSEINKDQENSEDDESVAINEVNNDII